MMAKETRQIRIRKDYFRNGYYSVHKVVYRDGKMTYESLIGFVKTKSGAELIKKNYMRSHPNG
jgi:hypothetical protein